MTAALAQGGDDRHDDRSIAMKMEHPDNDHGDASHQNNGGHLGWSKGGQIARSDWDAAFMSAIGSAIACRARRTAMSGAV
jgi:hypothetical protein